LTLIKELLSRKKSKKESVEVTEFVDGK